MQEEEISFPDVNYGDNNRDAYDYLINELKSPFLDHTYWEVFIFCMSYAYAKKLKPSAPSGKPTLNAKMFLAPTRHLMRSLAIAHYSDVSVIKNSKKVVNICEQYANAGIGDIYFRFKNKPLEKPVDNVFQEIIREVMQGQN